MQEEIEADQSVSANVFGIRSDVADMAVCYKTVMCTIFQRPSQGFHLAGCISRIQTDLNRTF